MPTGFGLRRSSESDNVLSARAQFEAISSNLRELDAGVLTIGKNHEEFLDAQELASGNQASNAERERAARANARIQAYDVREVAYTRAQRHAMTMFDDIDLNRCNQGDVFKTIPEALRRAEVKLDFYRDRLDLVLPMIEDGFMVQDGQGTTMVNVHKLQLLTQQRSRKDKSLQQAVRLNMPMEEGQGRVAFLNADTSALAQQLALLALAPESTSMQSPEQRAEHFVELGQRRDQRITSVKSRGKTQTQDRRAALLEDQFRKADRKENASRHRTLLVWMACIMACESIHAMLRRWRAFKGKRSSLQDGFELVIVKGSAGKTIDPNTLKKLSDGQGSSFENCLFRKLRTEEKEARSKLGLSKWFLLLRVIRFCHRIKRKVVLDRSAAIIKDIIEASWRGAAMRYRIKRYHSTVVWLQNELRQALEFRDVLIRTVYIPATFEAETWVLGEVLGVPSDKLQMQVQQLMKSFSPQLSTSAARSSRKAEPMGHRKTGPRASVVAGLAQAPAPRGTVDGEALAGGDLVSARKSVLATGGGKAARGSILAAQRNQAPESHLTKMMKKYRLNDELREMVAKKLMRENVSRWWLKYTAHKAEKREFHNAMNFWLKEVIPLGKMGQDDWPPFPRDPVPVRPELNKVDKKIALQFVKAALKQTQVGVLLS